MGTYYSVEPITTIAELKTMFPDETDYTLNWLFCSTSGVHGSYLTLDQFDPSSPDDEDDWPPYPLTVLVVQPRIVRVRYGVIDVMPDDVEWIRDRIRKTLAGVAESQEGNT